jgi:hypothetical protein
MQLEWVLYNWFTAMCSEGRLVTGSVIIGKAKCFYDEMKITDKCTLSEDRNKKLPVRT